MSIWPSASGWPATGFAGPSVDHIPRLQTSPAIGQRRVCASLDEFRRNT